MLFGLQETLRLESAENPDPMKNSSIYKVAAGMVSTVVLQLEHYKGTTLYIDILNVIKWKHFPRYWPFVLGIHRSLVNSPHKGQWRGALLFSLICVWINGWVNNREADDLRRYRTHYDVIVKLRMSRCRWTSISMAFNLHEVSFS